MERPKRHQKHLSRAEETRGERRRRCRSEGWQREHAEPDGRRDGGGRGVAELKRTADKRKESEKRAPDRV